MLQRLATSMRRQWLWRILLNRSAVHKYWSPYRKNTLYSVALMLLAAPLAVVVFPLLLVRSAVGRKVDLYELRIQNQFAWLVDHFERIRGSRGGDTAGVVVVVRSTFRHRGLAHLYRSQLRCLVLWSTGFSSLWAQVLLLQPGFLINRIVIHSRNYFALNMAVEPLAPTRRLLRLREHTLAELGCSKSRYVTMAVFTSTKEEQADPEYASKTLSQETIGAEFAESVDFLRATGVDVIMLGFPDSGKAHVPREIPRLSQFGEVGGLHEVALASGCLYLWADFVGAMWLREPFKRLSLNTNVDHRFAGKKTFNFPEAVLETWVSTLLRYQTPGGNLLTLREIMTIEPGFEAVARGELRVIRNSPEDLIDAHREMLSRVDGTWVVDDRIGALQDRLKSIFAEFPELHVLPISPSFLARYPYLLD